MNSLLPAVAISLLHQRLTDQMALRRFLSETAALIALYGRLIASRGSVMVWPFRSARKRLPIS